MTVHRRGFGPRIVAVLDIATVWYALCTIVGGCPGQILNTLFEKS